MTDTLGIDNAQLPRLHETGDGGDIETDVLGRLVDIEAVVGRPAQRYRVVMTSACGQRTWQRFDRRRRGYR